MKKTDKNQELIKKYTERHNGKRPVSRRDFLSAGVIGFSGLVISSALPRAARAAEADCPTASASGGLAPFVTLNLAGGAMLAANFVPHDQGLQPLSTYDDMGLGNGAVPIEREFGNVPFAGNNISKILDGIRQNSSAQTRANTAFVAVNVRSRDDSDANNFDISGMVAKAGLIGEILPNMGRRDSATGISQAFAKVKPPNPLIVSSFNDIQGAVGAPGTLGQLSQTQRTSFFNLVNKLSRGQAQRLLALSGGETLSYLVNCATDKNIELSQLSADGLDVRTNGALSGIWQVNQNTGGGSRDVVFGSMVNAALTKSAGSISLEMGGYDYHDNSRTTGDQRDFEAGQTIARILESAAALNTKVFLYVTTDGACRSEKSASRTAPWTSDRGSAGCVYMIAYDPAGRPSTTSFQLGHFTNGQAADDKFITGGNVELAASAIFANYLQFSGQLGLFERVVPGVFSTAQLDQVVKFG